MASSNVMELKINEKSYSYAKIYAALLKDEYQRKRAYASLVALYALINTLERTDNVIQKSMTLFRNPLLNEQYEISDFYINNWHIDVRVIVEGTSFLVPKTHYDNDIVPDFYAVVKIDKTLQKAELLGFAETAKVETQPLDYHYSSIPVDALISYDEFLSKVCTQKPIDFKDEDHELFKELYLSLMDEEMKPEIKNKLLKHLFLCPECRTEFCCFTGFEMVSCKMGIYPNIFDDMTLDIVGAQAVDDKKYEGQEKTIYFGSDAGRKQDSETTAVDVEEKNVEIEEITETDETNLEEEIDNSTKEDEQELIDTEIVLDDNEDEIVVDNSEETEMTVSDILDELFNMEEDYIEPEVPEQKEVNEEFDDSALDRAVDEKLKQLQEEATFEEDVPLDSYYDEFGEDVVDEVQELQEEIETSESSVSTDEIEQEELTQQEQENIEEPINNDEDTVLSETSDEELLLDEDTVEEFVDENENSILEVDEEPVTNLSEELQVIEGEQSALENIDDDLVLETEPILLDEDTASDIEIVDKNEEELEVIEASDDSDFSDVIEDITEEALEVVSGSDEADLSFHDDEIFDESEELINNVSENAKESIQQVIVDYDEAGEPVYSYITNVSQEAELITDDDFPEYEDDDDILNQEFETFEEYKEEVYTNKNLSSADRPVEYVQNEEDFAIKNTEETEEQTLDAQGEDNFEEYKDDKDDEIELPDDYVDDADSTPIDSDDDFESYDEANSEIQTSENEVEDSDENSNQVAVAKTSFESPEEFFDEDIDYSSSEDEAEQDSQNDAPDENFDENDDEDDYEDDDDDDDEEDDDEVQNKKKSSIIALLVVFLLLVAGGVGAFFFMKNKNQESSNSVVVDSNPNTVELPASMPTEPTQVTDMFGDETTPSDEELSEDDSSSLPPPPVSQTVEPSVVPTETVNKQQEINNSIVNAFTKSTNNLSLKAVNWKCSPQMYTDVVFKSYMQELDGILKLNLKKNILDVTENPAATEITAKMAIDKNGGLSKVLLETSSGSQQLDNVVLQSINETFEGQKSQNLSDSTLKQDMYYLKVVIKL